MWYLVVAILFTLAGGAGGYLWGSEVERKAHEVAGAAKQAAAGIATAANSAVDSVKKAL
jgi:uncharacterized protein (UPF0333 family)